MTAIATARDGKGGTAVIERDTAPPAGETTPAAISPPDPVELRARIEAILNRHPAVGLALGMVRGESIEFFHGHGLADIASHRPVTEDTVFRIGSITKPITASAVMQLWERGWSTWMPPRTIKVCATTDWLPAEAGFVPRRYAIS
ncbi:MAG: serine hydrolase domain-containing protein [Thermomicrobiales bacterium]